LQECTPESVVVSAIKAASLDLPIDQNLGFAYLIPYNNKKKTKSVNKDKDGKEIVKWTETSQYECQFQMGWKGYVQLAVRTNMYVRINVTEVVDGEYIGTDRRSGDVTINWDNDDASRSKKKVVGYLAYFRLVSGFEKELYMTVEQLEAHAKRYSQAYRSGYGKWVDDKPAMSKKTVLKLLISGYGALSTSLREAIKADQSVLGDDTYDYIDNEPVDN
jgi:recombination protein RecT